MQKLSLVYELQDLIRQVIKETGYKVMIQKGGTLTNSISANVLSKIDFKRRCLIVLYKPSLPSPEYAIAHEMAKFIRVANAPKSKQMMVIPTKKSKRNSFKLIQKELKEVDATMHFSEKELELFYLSLLGLLVNTPGNFWISKKLYEKPQLKKESLKELRQIFSSNKIKMNLSNVKNYPNTFLKAVIALDAAYALFLDELFGKIRFFKPFKGTEFEKLAVQLLRLNKKDKGYAGDIEVINNWAKVLGLEGCFEWKRV
jgi:hypothetical protein